MFTSKLFGALLITVAVLVVLIYVITLIVIPDLDVGGIRLADAVVRFSVLVGAMGFAVFIGYIGYLLVTSPVPKPVEEFVKEYKEQVGEQ